VKSLQDFTANIKELPPHTKTQTGQTHSPAGTVCAKRLLDKTNVFAGLGILQKSTDVLEIIVVTLYK